MKQPSDHSNTSSNDRRRFIGNTIKLAVLAGIVSPLSQACKNNEKKPDQPQPENKTNRAKHPSTRHKWNYEKLVINTKTNVIHLPTAVIYSYYDEIKHRQDVNVNGWENQVQGQIRLNKDQSGTILEILSLQKLRNEVNDESLSNAINTLSTAFSKECDNARGVNHNATNYRLHELMLQLVALNTTIPVSNKWQAFNEKAKKPSKFGKRQKWMETETAFNDRVKYVQDREADYKKRLSQRASKYSFT